MFTVTTQPPTFYLTPMMAVGDDDTSCNYEDAHYFNVELRTFNEDGSIDTSLDQDFTDYDEANEYMLQNARRLQHDYERINCEDV